MSDNSVSRNRTSLSLVERVKQHDESAWRRFVDLYYPLVYRWCQIAGLRQQDAADVTSDVFNAVFASIEKFEPNRLRGWLRSITRSKVIDLHRRKSSEGRAIGGTSAKQMLEHVPDPIDESDDSSEAETDKALLFMRAAKMIKDDFPSEYWQVFSSYVLEDRPAQEVADDVGVSRDQVYNVKRRVLKRLREEFAELVDM